ncbi:DUF3093 domain-containing protein [Mycolicibacterium confluentis]|uniref:DUF3093 domain-containing protein n=1 Tax=Mycolicibacterium confluentis TaxID=28047 RepID=UPI000D6AD1BE|nr:DUF3093 domain-containing protein [Mycolicibacterium confluentis]MCV7317796.1 DUF3093 domain-containing protein [Mycolicibacterium confluentis]
MSGSQLTSQSVRYRERLWVPWWWWPLGMGLAGLIALEVNQALSGVSGVPDWAPFAALFAVAAAALLWLGRAEVSVIAGEDGLELCAGPAHLPVSVISRTAVVPRSAKSAALGRQLDPAAYVLHRVWVGPMVLAVLDDADDPTPYWLVSSRHPDRLLAALKSEQSS